MMMNRVNFGAVETSRMAPQAPLMPAKSTKVVAQAKQVAKVAGPRQVAVRQAADGGAQSSTTTATVAAGEKYETRLQKPLGVLFKEGADLGIYISELNPRAGNIDPRMQVGDKLIRLSASFGDEIWNAAGYGQAMYAIRTRLGEVYLEFESRGGDTSIFSSAGLTDAEAQFRQERGAGNVGVGTREVQTMNYIRAQELKRQRTEIFGDGLDKFYKGEYKEALELFEKCIGLEPFQGNKRVKLYSAFYRSSQYNCACCYGALGNIDAGLECLEMALVAGYDNYKKVRKEDPNLAPLRKDPRFTEILDEFDLPFINPYITKAWNNWFGKKDEEKKE